jgi:Flp pilus assembly pilin Flp
MMVPFIKQDRGSTAIEIALLLPLLIGVLLISADLYSINRIRGLFEQSSHNLASILSQQSELNQKSFDHLIDSVLPADVLGDYSLVVSKVNLDRSMDWKPIHRGELEDICTENYQGGKYIGEIPEEDKDVKSQSFVVVQLCRMTADLTMNSGLLGDKLVESIAVNRMVRHSVELDEKLSKEVGVNYEKDY